MGEDTSNVLSSSGMIIIFSFVSVVFLFMAMLIIGGLNNYALGDLLGIVDDSVASGLIPSFMSSLADDTASTYLGILPYLDYIWFGAFISLVISSLIFSYNRRRENYFSLFTMSVLGIMIFVYVGSFIIQLTEWFRTEIFLKVFPVMSTYTPMFSWYLDNIGVINLVIIVLNILANYVDLDLNNFIKRKEGESFDEV